jgi:putative ABC transport system permease protein
MWVMCCGPPAGLAGGGEIEGGDFVATQTVFVRHDEAQEAMRIGGPRRSTSLTCVTVWTQRRCRQTRGAGHTERRSGRRLYAGEFAEHTRDRILTNILPILFMVLGLAFIVGLAVAGLTIYTATIEKAREYGI